MTSDSISRLKQQIRGQIRLRRQMLSAEQLLQSAMQLTEQYRVFADQRIIHKAAIYIQQDNELGTHQLIEELIEDGCQLYLPKLFEDGSNQLSFVRFDPDCEMVNNRFGIPEPVTTETIAIDALDVIFMPLAAFDQQGNRLGMGGGYYDRSLAGLSNNKTRLIGLAYDFQQIPSCPVEAFDQPLEMAITPTRVLHFNL